MLAYFSFIIFFVKTIFNNFGFQRKVGWRRKFCWNSGVLEQIAIMDDLFYHYRKNTAVRGFPLKRLPSQTTDQFWICVYRYVKCGAFSGSD